MTNHKDLKEKTSIDAIMERKERGRVSEEAEKVSGEGIEIKIPKYNDVWMDNGVEIC